MNKLGIHTVISVSLAGGRVCFNFAEYINGTYTGLCSVDVDATPGSDAVTPKEVEFTCMKLASVINALIVEERKQLQDPASCPKILLEGSDFERYVADKIMKKNS